MCSMCKGTHGRMGLRISIHPTHHGEKMNVGRTHLLFIAVLLNACMASDIRRGSRARFSGDAKIVRVRLDPTEREIRALFDNLDRHQQKLLKKGKVASAIRPENARHQVNR
jgi:hypothetical protein